MTSLNLLCRLSIVAAIGVVLGAASGRAATDDPRRLCLQEARGDRRDCVTVCRDDYREAALLCGTACAQECALARKACRAPIKAQLAADIKACNTTLSAAVLLCRQQKLADPDFDKDGCIDTAQITAFICRDDAREIAFPALNGCRHEYRICINACP